jgi:hypothetical protein
MKEKSLLALYFRSNLNLIMILVSGVLILNVLIFGVGLERLLLTLVILACYMAAFAFFFFSRQGAKQIVSEREKERLSKVKEKILYYKQLRDRISFLRIADDDVRNAVEYFLISLGNYLNRCSELSNYSPQANKRTEEVLEVCQIYLEKLDETSIDGHFKVGSKEFTDFKERTINFIKDSGGFIKEKMNDELVGLTQEEKIEVIEEINKK